MAGSKHASSCTCILIILLVSSHLAPCEARRLMAASAKINGDAACESSACRAAQGAASGAASTSEMASTDGRGTGQGHSPGIGNKLHASGNGRR
ncbi:uncharacterized protein LOC123399581 [Hordeum vulgare subsp. vulgare]|uniref:uncharacterized protein LOC123399581 n=1 Tax=Hordeum vulgare subsp. vulgare TaxID=112509 RepID=UPI001D1A371C|nr:uncharacterized protein LOC123399581 [Hordeum vulgare subsp. vulgare]KAI4990057.1 hypothetical protein ZWY2020_038420 [Hordeum vulgare]